MVEPGFKPRFITTTQSSNHERILLVTPNVSFNATSCGPHPPDLSVPHQHCSIWHLLPWFPFAQMLRWSLVALLFLSTPYMLVSPQALSLALSSWCICALWVSLCTPDFSHPLDTDDSKTYFWSPYHAQHGSDFLHFQSVHAPLCLRSVSKTIACLVI